MGMWAYINRWVGLSLDIPDVQDVGYGYLCEHSERIWEMMGVYKRVVNRVFLGMDI